MAWFAINRHERVLRGKQSLFDRFTVDTDFRDQKIFFKHSDRSPYIISFKKKEDGTRMELININFYGNNDPWDNSPFETIPTNNDPVEQFETYEGVKAKILDVYKDKSGVSTQLIL